MKRDPDRYWRGGWLVILLGLLLLGSGCATTPPSAHVASPRPANVAPSVPKSSIAKPQTNALPSETQSVGHRILWYIPNRLLDAVDIFRLRVRVGPGLAANIRMTDYANLYMGRYRTVFVGLPGPRLKPQVRLPYGIEQERGLLVMGVDATDDLPDDPGYSPTEFVVGAQLLVVGLEWGFDPVELGDFLAGFILMDTGMDDR